MPTSQHIGLYSSVQRLARLGFTDSECLEMSGAAGCGRDLLWVQKVNAVIRREQEKKRSEKWKCWECGRSFNKKTVRCPVCEPVGAMPCVQ